MVLALSKGPEHPYFYFIFNFYYFFSGAIDRAPAPHLRRATGARSLSLALTVNAWSFHRTKIIQYSSFNRMIASNADRDMVHFVVVNF